MVERARWPVAGDVAAEGGGRDPGFGAQRRDDRAVDVSLADRVRAYGEQQVDVLAGLAVQPRGLGGPQGLPGFDGLADDRVDGLGERGAGLVDRYVEQADGVGGEDLAGGTQDGQPVVLPAGAAGPEPGHLLAAQSGGQPGPGER